MSGREATREDLDMAVAEICDLSSDPSTTQATMIETLAERLGIPIKEGGGREVGRGRFGMMRGERGEWTVIERMEDTRGPVVLYDEVVSGHNADDAQRIAEALNYATEEGACG